MNQIFNKGETIVCLTDPESAVSQPREKGKIYKVEAVQYCSHCGQQHINLGVKTEANWVDCACGGSSPTHGRHWTNSTHFLRPSELKETELLAAKNEAFENAALLRDIQKLIPQ